MSSNNKVDCQWESIQDGGKTSDDVRCRNMCSASSTIEEVGCGGNGDVKIAG